MIPWQHAFALALRSLAARPVRAAVLVLGVAVALFLPAFTFTAAGRLDQELLARAQASPLLVGRRGNELDLTLTSLYFRGTVDATLKSGEVDRITRAGFGLAIPLYLRHSAGGAPLVGTDPQYLDARGLNVADGRAFALLGEIVAGASLAHAFDLKVGDTIRSDQANLYNLAGAYPFLLEVVGILAPTGGPDDEAFFTDLNTTWALDGFLHGHGQVTQDQAVGGSEAEGNLTASAALFMFDRFDDAQRSTFHLHGDRAELPLTSVLVFPPDQRAHDELLGEYALDETLQAVRPVEVIKTVLAVVFTIRDALGAWFALVALSTGALFALVIALGLRLRAAELRLMALIGSSRGVVAAMVGAEIVLIVGVAGALAWAATAGALRLLTVWL